MKNNYMLIHGSFGSPFSNWIPWLRRKIEEKELDVYTPDLPTGVTYQNYTNWSNVMDGYVSAGVLNENTVIYAHSIAPVFICKFLVERKIKVKRIVSVCGFNNYFGINKDFDTVNGNTTFSCCFTIDKDYDTVNRTMYFDNLKDIKNYCNDIICFYTENDPYVKQEVEKKFSDTIATKVVIIKDGGHLNAESNYIEFNELLEYL